MNVRILVGVDTDLSPLTQHTLRTVGELFQDSPPGVYLILLHVIPMTQVIAAHPGWYIGQDISFTPSSWQRSQAEEILRKAGALMQQQGITAEQSVIRSGATVDEIVKTAREMRANLVVVGSHGDSFLQRVRRFFIGSISHSVLRAAPCPVMIVTSPHSPRATDLVAWYEEAIRRYLDEHTHSLSVFTAQQVAQQFAPPNKKKVGRKEVAAAILALERLANDGMLCRHTVQGEPRYVND